MFSNQEQFKDKIFDDDNNSWKKILLEERMIEPLNHFFEITDIDTIDLSMYNSSIIGNDKLRDFQNDLCKSTILSHIIRESYFHENYNRFSLFPYNTKSQYKIFVLADKRNEVLSVLEGKNIIEVNKWQKVEGIPYFRGWEIYFTSIIDNGKYRWWDSLYKEIEQGKWEEMPDVTLDNIEKYLINK